MVVKMCEPLRGKRTAMLQKSYPDKEIHYVAFKQKDVKSAVEFYIGYLENELIRFNGLHEYTKNDERYLMAITVTYEHLNKLKETFQDVID